MQDGLQWKSRAGWSGAAYLLLSSLGGMSELPTEGLFL
jgi:hypothetical protein